MRVGLSPDGRSKRYGLPARSRRVGHERLDSCAGWLRCDGADQIQQLCVPDGTAARPEWPPRISTARQDSWGLKLDQRDVLCARKQVGLRPLGLAWQSRLVL